MSSRTTLGRQAVALPAPDPVPLGDRRYRVPSSTDPAVTYAVDLDADTCTCPAGQHGRPCKHRRSCEAAESAATARRRQDGAEGTNRSNAAPAPAQAEKDGAPQRDATPIAHGRCRDCGAEGALLDGVCLFGACYPAAAHAARRRR